MYVTYKLKDNKTIKMFLGNDVLESALTGTKLYIDEYEVSIIDENNTYQHEIIKYYQENNELYFIYNGEKIKVLDFHYYKTDELIKKISDNPKSIKESELLATLLMDTDNIAFLLERSIPINVLLGLYKIYHSFWEDYAYVLSLPVEKTYKKSEWSYKIDLIPVKEEDKIIFGTKEIYFHDFYSFIKIGKCKIINRRDIKQYQNNLGKCLERAKNY